MGASIEKAKGETVHLGDEDYEENYDSFLMERGPGRSQGRATRKGRRKQTVWRIIMSTTPPLKDHYERWLDEEAATSPDTARQHRQVIQELGWAGEDICIGEVNRKRAGQYVDELLSPRQRTDRKTSLDTFRHSHRCGAGLKTED